MTIESPQPETPTPTERLASNFLCSVCNQWKPGQSFVPRKLSWMPIVCIECDEQIKRENE